MTELPSGCLEFRRHFTFRGRSQFAKVQVAKTLLGEPNFWELVDEAFEFEISRFKKQHAYDEWDT